MLYRLHEVAVDDPETAGCGSVARGRHARRVVTPGATARSAAGATPGATARSAAGATHLSGL
jgi:hypothetical protein